MHELNVLLEVVDQVEELARKSKIKKVKAIVLQIGELSSVVPMFMEQYYPLMIEEKDVLHESKLIIETIPGIAKCLSCDKEYNVVAHDGHCPICNTFEKDVLQGSEFIIKELWV